MFVGQYIVGLVGLTFFKAEVPIMAMTCPEFPSVQLIFCTDTRGNHNKYAMRKLPPTSSLSSRYARLVIAEVDTFDPRCMYTPQERYDLKST